MSDIMTRQKLNARRDRAKMNAAAATRTVLICAGTGCIAGGSLKIYDYLKEECERRGITVMVNLMDDESQCAGHAINMKKSGCHGFCEMGPLLQIEPEGYL